MSVLSETEENDIKTTVSDLKRVKLKEHGPVFRTFLGNIILNSTRLSVIVFL